MLSAAVTKVSKKRQVRRATRRKALASASETGRLPASAGDRLTQRAMAGDTSQARMKGAASAIESPTNDQANRAARTAKITLPAIWPKNARQSERSTCLACAAATHSRRLRRLT